MSIKAKIFTGSLWSIAGTGTTLLSNFIVFALLARLLQPVDFGLVAFAAIFIDLARNLMSGGIAESLIQRKEWDETAASTSFWLVLASSVLFTLGTAGITVPLAYLYGSPTLAEIFLVLSLSLLIDGVRGVHEAKLRREFGYKALAARTVIASIVSGICGIALALAGFGVWALVASRLVAAALQTIVVLCSISWAPRFVFSRAECAGLLRFGADIVGSRLVVQLNGRVAELVVGLVLGPVALGFFNVAGRALNLLFQIAISPIQTTALSAFSRLKDARAIGDAYLRMTRATALVAFPIFFGAAATAPDFVVVCFGNHWQPSGTIMTLLAIAAVPTALITFVQPALVAVGRTRLALSSNFIVLVASTAAVLVAVPFGIVAVAIARAVRAHATAPYMLSALRKGVGLPIGQALRSVWEPWTAAAAMCAAVMLARLYVFDDIVPFARLLICVALGGVVYLVLLLTIARRYTAETMLELMPHLPAGARTIARRIVPML